MSILGKAQDAVFGGGGEEGAKGAKKAMGDYGNELMTLAPKVGGTADPYSEYRQNSANMLNSLITGTDYYMPTQQKAYDPGILGQQKQVNLTKKQQKQAKAADKQLQKLINLADNPKKAGKAEAKLNKTLASMGLSDWKAGDLAKGFTTGAFTSLADVFKEQHGQTAGIKDAIYGKPASDPTTVAATQGTTDPATAAATGNQKYQWQTDPGYKFRLEEANREVERAMGAKGYNESGNILNAITQRTQDVASSEYQNIINRLMNVAGATPQNAIAGAESYSNAYGQGLGAKYGGKYNYQMFKANNDTGLMGTINNDLSVLNTTKSQVDQLLPTSSIMNSGQTTGKG